MTKHLIHPDAARLDGKAQLLKCKECKCKTLHTTPFFGYPFQCVANHGGSTLCNGCDLFITEVSCVVVEADGQYRCYCDACSLPDSPEKNVLVNQQKLLAQPGSKNVDCNNPFSLARALGASSIK